MTNDVTAVFGALFFGLIMLAASFPLAARGRGGKMSQQAALLFLVGTGLIIFSILQIIYSIWQFALSVYKTINDEIIRFADRYSISLSFIQGGFLFLAGLSVLLVGLISWYRRRQKSYQEKIDHLTWEREKTVSTIDFQKRYKTDLIAREKSLRALEISNIDDMTGVEFENYIGDFLKAKGYSVIVTKVSNDLGVDIIAEKDSQKYAVQVKRHSKPVSRRAISDVVAGKQHYKCEHAVVITNNSFQKGAIKLAESTSCELIDREKLSILLAEFHQIDIKDSPEVCQINNEIRANFKKVKSLNKEITYLKQLKAKFP